VPIAIVLLPWIGAVATLAAPVGMGDGSRASRRATVTAVAVPVLLLWSWIGLAIDGVALAARIDGITSFDLALALDPLSLVFCSTTAVVVLAAVLLVGAHAGTSMRLPLLLGGLLAIEGAANLFFAAADLLTFQIGWELTGLISVALVAAGRRGRSAVAALRMLVYLSLGSVAMMLATSSLTTAPYDATGTWTYLVSDVAAASPSPLTAIWIASALAAACAVRLPLLPVHGWLAPVLVAAEPAVAMVIVAVVTKTGLYAFLRLGGLVPADAVAAVAQPVFWIAAASTLFAGFSALLQLEMRRLTAWLTMGGGAGVLLAGIARALDGFEILTAATVAAVHALALATLLAVTSAFELRRTAMHDREIRGAAATMSRWAQALLLAAVSAGIAFLLAGISVLDHIAGGTLPFVLPAASWVMVLLVVGLALWPLSVARPVAAVYAERPPAANRGLRDLNNSEWLAVAVLIGAIAIGGVCLAAPWRDIVRTNYSVSGDVGQP
jgi:NADH-quinone oxidoreductase subunit M